MLELELLVLKKQTNPSFEAHRKISRGLWGKKKEKKKRQPDVRPAVSLAVCLSSNKPNAFGLDRGCGRCPCCDSNKSRMD